jgi:flagellar protein FlaG
MSILQNSSEIGLTNLAADYKRSADSLNTNDVTKQIVQEKNTVTPAIDNKTIEQKANEVSENNEPLNAKQLEKVAQQLQDFVGGLNRNLEFSVDKDSGRDVIKVFDKDSGDLLKQYPSEEVLTLVSKLSEMVGGFVDAKV